MKYVYGAKVVDKAQSRPPHGGRGLKFIVVNLIRFDSSRPPHGGRGLKYTVRKALFFVRDRRPPHGGRGLKCKHAGQSPEGLPSPSTRRAWIEILQAPVQSQFSNRRPPHGRLSLKQEVISNTFASLTTVFLLFWSSVF